MRIVIDALGAPAESGGMRVHAEELIRTWTEVFPADELIVLGYSWLEDSFRGVEGVEVVTAKGKAARYTGQIFWTAQVFRRRHADALLSLSTIVSPFVPSDRTACFIHDWRHRLNPAEFGRAQRLYRRLWQLSIRRAGTTFAISEKTRRETERFARPARLVVAENGDDHARRWGVERIVDQGTPTILTFGHFASKRPELVIDAVSVLRRGGEDHRLVVLGAKGDYREELRKKAEVESVSDLVEFPGFVTDDTLHRSVSSASVLALVSSDEGYGMPVVEGAYFGVPTVVTADSGLVEIHGDRVVPAEATGESVASAILRARESGPERGADAHPWSDTVRTVRDSLRARARTTMRGE
ncbi:glycosyltransferase involved in cell wall biosynthesis [Microbacterium foliorum]|uniref:glycosyltransferase n=1 Tax=Microbacterium foliorum TaxID=104336 RepID=UPI00209D93FA|nr:glycosyltransferase [Microbacterium foliorum]MCP1427632.1 glycosyltransferase involved in cell wall biosynthesis [Microbacterium foliorum]